jgi:uncharacterized protein
MRVVSNTSPLQYLHVVQQLPVLERLYGNLIVPQAVVDELSVGRQHGYDVPDCTSYSWMHIETVAIPSILRLVTNLGAGEAEALALALIQATDLVILDDALARQVAASQNIRYTGTLGVLIQAKAQGLVTDVMPLIDSLESAGFRLTSTLKLTVQRIVGE